MKIQNQFAQMQTKDNFIKLIEIRKEKSFTEHMQGTQWFKSLYEKTASVNMYTRNGLSLVNMEIDDCIHNQEPDFSHINNCKYKLVFNGYQRIKVNDLKDLLKEVKLNDNDKEKLTKYKFSNNFWYKKLTYIIYQNLNWLFENKNWLFDEYLKYDEYCIIYFIDKEETFKANKWELK